MLEEKLSYQVIGCCMQVHSQLGPGLLEACYWLVGKLVKTSLSIDVASMTTCRWAYHNGLFYELKKQGLDVQYNAPFSVVYEGHVVGEYFADLVVNNRVLLELKAVKSFSDAHVAQLLNYLHISGVRVGYLVNFQGTKLAFKRLVV